MDSRFKGPGGTWAGGPSERQKNYASNLQEQDALISAYEHLTGLPEPVEALTRLRKIASLVKPIMRKRGWHVGTLTEFLPEDPRLLGLNINHGQKICVRLRFSHRPSSFLTIEQCVDTMLHELSHIVHGPHDAKFHALWDELRSEHETLLLKGYTGEGFLTKGHRLGGGRPPPNAELRRLARQNAEKRGEKDKRDRKATGFKLGGKRIRPGEDARKVIAEAVERRNSIERGCASGTTNAEILARQDSQRTVRTTADDNDANDRAIAEALLELMEEEEMAKLDQSWDPPGQSSGLAWDAKNGLTQAARGRTPPAHMTEEEQIRWALQESLRTTTSSAGRRIASPSPPRIAQPVPRAAGRAIPQYNLDGSAESSVSNRHRAAADNDRLMPGAEGPISSTKGLLKSASSASSNNTKNWPGCPLLEAHPASRCSSANSVLSDLAGALGAASPPTSKEAPPPPPPAATTTSQRLVTSSGGDDDDDDGNAPRSGGGSSSSAVSPLTSLDLASLANADHPSVGSVDLTIVSPPDDDHPGADVLVEEGSWTCDICTCINPRDYLACSACNLERPSYHSAPISAVSTGRPPWGTCPTTTTTTTAIPKPKIGNRGLTSLSSSGSSSLTGVHPASRSSSSSSAAANLERLARQSALLQRPRSLGWACRRCGTFMEHRYWTCSVCGLMKGDSRADEHVLS